MLEALISIDQALTLGINEAHSASADSLMILISEKRTWIPLYIGLVLLINKIFGWKRALLIVGFVALNVVLTDQISVFFKESFLRLRPCHDPAIVDLLHLPDGCGGTYGFVSSHAANTMGLAVILALILQNRWITISMLAFAIVNGYSRIYLGKHFFFDVLGGFVLGALIAYGVYRLLLITIKRFHIP
ncbi:MAG: phosphatase PAP2 family protein [Flavobacteriales bacterium]|nr:phosphatase PAP2 family protein [Flavobacteriales bacterium]